MHCPLSLCQVMNPLEKKYYYESNAWPRRDWEIERIRPPEKRERETGAKEKWFLGIADKNSPQSHTSILPTFLISFFVFFFHETLLPLSVDFCLRVLVKRVLSRTCESLEENRDGFVIKSSENLDVCVQAVVYAKCLNDCIHSNSTLWIWVNICLPLLSSDWLIF